jgi:hypothetical protein
MKGQLPLHSLPRSPLPVLCTGALRKADAVFFFPIGIGTTKEMEQKDRDQQKADEAAASSPHLKAGV